jgi:hypothetical protein
MAPNRAATPRHEKSSTSPHPAIPNASWTDEKNMLLIPKGKKRDLYNIAAPAHNEYALESIV